VHPSDTQVKSSILTLSACQGLWGPGHCLGMSQKCTLTEHHAKCIEQCLITYLDKRDHICLHMETLRRLWRQKGKYIDVIVFLNMLMDHRFNLVLIRHIHISVQVCIFLKNKWWNILPWCWHFIPAVFCTLCMMFSRSTLLRDAKTRTRASEARACT
jgi:hypothetical protein